MTSHTSSFNQCHKTVHRNSFNTLFWFTPVFHGLSFSFVVYGFDLLGKLFLVFIVLVFEVPGPLRYLLLLLFIMNQESEFYTLFVRYPSSLLWIDKASKHGEGSTNGVHVYVSRRHLHWHLHCQYLPRHHNHCRLRRLQLPPHPVRLPGTMFVVKSASSLSRLSFSVFSHIGAALTALSVVGHIDEMHMLSVLPRTLPCHPKPASPTGC
jgi:hypothetical protein